MGQAVHDASVPGVGFVLKRFAQEASADNAAAWIGNQQLRVGELVHAQAAASAAGALRIVEHEVLRLDAAVDEMVSLAAQPAVELLGLAFIGSF